MFPPRPKEKLARENSVRSNIEEDPEDRDSQSQEASQKELARTESKGNQECLH